MLASFLGLFELCVSVVVVLATLHIRSVARTEIFVMAVVIIITIRLKWAQ